MKIKMSASAVVVNQYGESITVEPDADIFDDLDSAVSAFKGWAMDGYWPLKNPPKFVTIELELLEDESDA